MAEDVSDSIYPPLETIEKPIPYGYGGIKYDFPFENQATNDDSADDEESLAGEPYRLPRENENVNDDFDPQVLTLDHSSDENLPSEDESAPGESPSTNGKRGRPRGRGRARGRGRRDTTRGSRLRARTRRGDEERGPGRPKGSGRGVGMRGQVKKGKLSESRANAELQSLNAQATSAYLNRDLERALDLARKAIQINPEIFTSHSLVSQIYDDLGRPEDALAILWSGAHTQHDAGIWWEVANRTQELALNEPSAVQEQVMYCYNKIVRLNDKDYEARRGRMYHYMNKGFNKKAMREAEACWSLRPLNLENLQVFAHLSLECKLPLAAKKAYDVAAEHYWNEDIDDPSLASAFTFSDLHIYGELFDALKQWGEGLKKLKQLARWLCGRKSETFWDSITDNDCEWDFDDEPRRILVSEYIPGTFDNETYGNALPPEVRAQFGLFRLKLGGDSATEAFHHLALFEPEDVSASAPVQDFPDIFQTVADTLRQENYIEEALRFYDPLLRTKQYNIKMRPAMAELYRLCGRTDEALELYQNIAHDEHTNHDALISIAKMYESLAQPEKALEWINKVLRMGYVDAVKKAKFSLNIPSLVEPAAKGTALPGVRGKRNLEQRDWNPKQKLGGITEQTLKLCYQRSQTLTPAMRAGESSAVAEWIECAETLTSFFRDQPIFYPNVVSVPFLGYSREARKKARMVDWDAPPSALEHMAGRLRHALGKKESAESYEALAESGTIPTDFGGISFVQWLDYFCELGFNYARLGEIESTFDILAAATCANVFYFSEESIMYIHTVELTCALMLKDEKRISNCARWFMTQYAWSTDAFRVYQAAHRIQAGDLLYYNSGPNQKFVRRSIRSFDYAVMDDVSRANHGFAREEVDAFSKSTPRNSDEMPARPGNPYGLSKVDPQLLVLYGNLLHSASSFQNALNYYLRAYAADPSNALTLLSISTAYLQNGFKRQTENRHHYILQAFSFFSQYKEARMQKVPNVSSKMARWLQRQRKMEVEFNEGRMWHSLGLFNLATPAYERCLRLSDENKTDQETNDAAVGAIDDNVSEEGGRQEFIDEEANFSMEAALALQNLLAINGDTKSARQIVEKYLVF